MTGRPNRGTGIPSDPTRQQAQGFDRRHPPFDEGNAAHLVHGADSERAISAAAELVHDTILDVAPWLAQPQFAPAVHRYLRAAAREQLLD